MPVANKHIPWRFLWRSWLIGAVTFASAGLFQFSPLKERCLDMCRTPLGFFLRHYRKGVGPAWHLGLRHGGYCLGFCWALMLVMLIEKAMPGGKRLSPLIGIALLLLGIVWLVHPLWLRSAGV